MRRRNFIKNSSKTGLALTFLGMYACKEAKKEKMETDMKDADLAVKEIDPFFKLSLAQWSIHKMIKEDGVDPYTFAEKAKNWGFSGLEYVSQLYPADMDDNEYSEDAMASFIEKSKSAAEKHGMQNVLIMIDGQGNLAVSDEAERNAAVERHHKWVDAAQAMGCHSIRVNLAGSDDPEQWKANSVDGLTQLGEYAQGKNINVLVENHGGLSSNAAMLADVMATVDMDNVGTLPDFGNFCIERSDDGCAEMYDIYRGVKELMPYAKAVSAKSHDFDAQGNETEIDYVRMLKIVKDHGYTGFIGVEYEGSELSEEEGIMATKNLMLKAAKELG